MYERMLKKQVRPTEEDMIRYCGATGALFRELQEFLTERGATQKEIRFPYGNAYGWSVKHSVKKKLVCDVFAEREAFSVMLRLTNDQFDSVYRELLEYTRQYIDGKYPCGSGGWIHYRVLCREHLEDIKKLLSVKLGL